MDMLDDTVRVAAAQSIGVPTWAISTMTNMLDPGNLTYFAFEIELSIDQVMMEALSMRDLAVSGTGAVEAKMLDMQVGDDSMQILMRTYGAFSLESEH